MKLTLKNRIVLLVFAMMMCTGALGYLAYQKSGTLMANLDEVSQTQMPAIRFMTLADMMHDGIRGVVLDAVLAANDHDAKRLKELDEESKEKTKEFQGYIEDLLKLNIKSETKKELKLAEPEVAAYGASALEVVGIAVSGKYTEAHAKLPEFQEHFEKLEKVMDKLGKMIRDDANQTRDGGKDVLATIIWMSIFSFAFGVLVSFFMIQKINAEITALTLRLESSAVSMNEAGDALGQVANAVSAASIQQNSAVHEAVASLSEISSMVRQTSQASKESMEVALSVSHLAEKGKTAMEQVVNSMALIEGSNQDLQSIAATIGEIDRKATVINDIVFKTQLLSFNASIEAARAGEQGRGFSVVAEEVGALAELSGTAAKSIHDLLGESKTKVDETLRSIRSKVSEGNQVSDQAMKTFLEITRSIQEINERLKSSTEASVQQELGIEQTQKAMQELNSASQKNQDSAQASKKVSDHLGVENKGLRNVVNELETLVRGKNAA